MRAMTKLLNDRTKIRAGGLVFIADVGQGSSLDLSADPAALRDLASAVAGVGGTLNTFNRSASNDRSHYSLVGWGGAGEATGVETSSLKDPSRGDARLQGALTRDHQSLFKPTT